MSFVPFNLLYFLIRLTVFVVKEYFKLNTSGAYQGANYFEYKGKKLKDLPDIF